MKNQIARYHAKRKIFPVLVGDQVVLKEIKGQEFYEKYREWLDSRDIINGIGEERLSLEGVVRLHSEWRKDKGNLTLGIYGKETHRPLGDVNLCDSEEFEDGPEIAIMGGERGRGIGTEAMRLMLGYAFGTINVSRVNLTVYKDNPAVRLYQRIGFETIRERTDEENGKAEYEMSLRKEIWRRLSQP